MCPQVRIRASPCRASMIVPDPQERPSGSSTRKRTLAAIKVASATGGLSCRGAHAASAASPPAVDAMAAGGVECFAAAAADLHIRSSRL